MTIDYNALLDSLEAERDELNATIAYLRKRAGMAPYGEPEAAPAVAPYPARKPGPTPKQGCEKHPGSDRAGNGQCRECAREYRRQRWADRRRAATPPVQEGTQAPVAAAHKTATQAHEIAPPVHQEAPPAHKSLNAKRCKIHGAVEFYASGQCKECNRESRERFAAKRKAVPVALVPPVTLTVKCLDCGKQFANARELGQHTTREHFGERSVQGSSLGGL